MRKNQYAKVLQQVKSALTAEEKQQIIWHVVEVMDQANVIATHRAFGHGKKRNERRLKALADVCEEFEVEKRLNDLDYADGKLEEAYKRIMEG